MFSLRLHLLSLNDPSNVIVDSDLVLHIRQVSYNDICVSHTERCDQSPTRQDGGRQQGTAASPHVRPELRQLEGVTQHTLMIQGVTQHTLMIKAVTQHLLRIH